MKVKIFVSSDSSSVEEQANRWLKQNSGIRINFQQFNTIFGNDAVGTRYSLFFSYQESRARRSRSGK
ncbi:MAG: hypothetical protein COV10_02320 [Candidatus Vogelbacteria bacterium CG10_big_fil_rev_8_21_14_0_10_51_16]|uniref:Uncharacterized protein n=1 Tax=Candidatus Vogelbacteria bacterium CG10_big_fil_rev_8_21_14_0_10_51_16 TaxID=1975045 RepID=A0A2H0REE5_9BACT|nr:MAG: hypothetical protein COV10_02320 [Candidatus Vogelbacteria bacterium CG10_big_fil_rev_8_21_14_0_10_51_16]